jgi:hypothetical protein
MISENIVYSSNSADRFSLGRSSGKGSFAIWTYNLKGREWHSEFVPKNAPSNTRGVSAVTLQAGEQWLGMYIF